MKKDDKRKLDILSEKVLSHQKSTNLPLNTQFLLIEHNVDGAIIHQRPRDGYINATELCRKAGKQFSDYSRLNSTTAYLEALSAERGIPRSDLVHIIKGGTNEQLRQQGTWVHPYVATHLGQWLCNTPIFRTIYK